MLVAVAGALVTLVLIVLRVKGAVDLGRELRRDREKIQGREPGDA